MKMKLLLRYLSILTIFSLIVACDDDDKITDNLPPEDANLYSLKQLTLTNTNDFNGNTYVTSGTLNVDADISDAAPEGFTKQVYIQVVKIVSGEETVLATGGAFNLSKNGTADLKTFELDFNDIVEGRTEVNLAANIMEAGSDRKLKGRGLLVKAETTTEDNKVDYKIKSIEWNGTDLSQDGYYSSRDVTFTVAVEGSITQTITGEVKLVNDKTLDTLKFISIPAFEVQREGFSSNEINFTINSASDLDKNGEKFDRRAGFEIILDFFDSATGELVFEQFYKAADFVRIGFETEYYDGRDYFVYDNFPNQPTLDTFQVATPGGYADSAILEFSVKCDRDLVYGNSLDFELELPKVRVLYTRPYDPEFVGFATLTTINIDTDPYFGAGAEILVDLKNSITSAEDTATYDFIIQVLEPADNFFTSSDDFVRDEYTKADNPALGGVRINP